MLNHDGKARLKRNAEKIAALLNLLKQETYTDAETVRYLFDFKHHKSVYTLLAKVENMGLIQKHVFTSRVGKIPLWGITLEGIAVSYKPDDPVLPVRFEPSRLSGWSLDHHLNNQYARLILEKKGATGWINGDRNTFLSQFQVKHRPDGLITLPGNTCVAVETESSLKTKARYQSIINSHLGARTKSLWLYVFYVVPDAQKKASLTAMFNSITYVIENHQHIPLEAKHRNVFRIYTLDELKTLELTNYA